MDDAELDEALARITGRHDRPRHELVRFAFLRALGLVYTFAFLGATQQLPALIGPRGLLPAGTYLEGLAAAHGSTSAAFFAQPTIFFAGASDGALLLASYLGLALSLAVLAGVTNALVMALLWALQLSIVHVGQTFYGYGWEILLLEAGFLAIWMCPLRSLRPLPAHEAPHSFVWLLRWLAFRVMFGAGLIKLRGDTCWDDLSCLVFHYETQPLPNPLSWALHHAPAWFHTLGVVVNHLVELFVPFFLFGPRRLRYAGGAIIIAFQAMLIASGNLSFLNWLTIAVSLGAFDDRLLARAVPRLPPIAPPPPPSNVQRATTWAIVAVVAFLSVDPLMNLFAYRQIMNTSFDRLHLVNTYGAFGSVNRARHEVILEGTHDDPADPAARWVAYELPCKPGDPARAPCAHAPYHHRLDWQLWFASFRDYEQEPWIVHLAAQLLAAEPGVMTLFANDPFPDRPPRFVRATLYRYSFTEPGEPGWWRRERVGAYLRPLSRGDPELRAFLARHGWDR